jgi:hypothetical protein
MSQFYISNAEPEVDVKRCRQSKAGRFPIIITGRTEAGEIKAFTGIVQSVEYFRQNPGDMCWRITMEDAN